MNEGLHSLIRQLKAELAWATRTGVQPARRRPPVVVREVEPLTPPPPVVGRPGGDESLRGPPEPRGPRPDEAPSTTGDPPASAAPAIEAARTLGEVRAILGDCTRCRLCHGRTHLVFGVGSEDADVMFIGEGPGADEDRKGEPFVGKAGQLLTRIIENGMQMKREQVYIANIVKCRPPGNRDPEPDEVAACEPFLAAQIRAVAPRVIVTLGKYASQTLLGVTTPITRLRGRWSDYRGTPVMPTYHPAYLLRNPAEKRPVWEDIQEVLEWLGRPVSPRS